MKIALIGYGKMGHIIESIALQRGHEIVCIIDKDNTDDFSCEAFASADVAIEFTTPHTAAQNILSAWKAGVPVVCGTYLIYIYILYIYIKQFLFSNPASGKLGNVLLSTALPKRESLYSLFLFG